MSVEVILDEAKKIFNTTIDEIISHIKKGDFEKAYQLLSSTKKIVNSLLEIVGDVLELQEFIEE